MVTVSSAVGFLCALVVLQLLRSGGEQVLFQCTMLLPVLRLITGLFCLCYPWNNFTPQEYYHGMDDDAIRYLAYGFYILVGGSLTICSLCNCCISMHVRHLARPWLSLQASLMRCVSMVVLANPGMLLVPLGCAVLLYFWIVGCISAFTSILDAETSGWPEAAIIPTILLISWGGGTAAPSRPGEIKLSLSPRSSRRRLGSAGRCRLVYFHPGILRGLQPMVSLAP